MGITSGKVQCTIQNKDGSTVKMKIDKKSPGKDTSFTNKVKNVFYPSRWTWGQKKSINERKSDCRDCNYSRSLNPTSVEEEDDYQSLNPVAVEMGDDYQFPYQTFSTAASYQNVPSTGDVATPRCHWEPRFDQLCRSSNDLESETDLDMDSKAMYVNTGYSKRNDLERVKSYSSGNMCAERIKHTYMEKNINKESSRSHQPEKPTRMNVGRIEPKEWSKVCGEFSDSSDQPDEYSKFDESPSVDASMYGAALHTHEPLGVRDLEDSHEYITMKPSRISVEIMDDEKTNEMSSDLRKLKRNDAESVVFSSFESDNDDLDEPIGDRKAYFQQFYRKLQAEHPKAPSEHSFKEPLKEEDRASKPRLASFRSFDSTATIDSIASEDDFDRVEYLQNLHQDLGKEQNYCIFESKPPNTGDYINVTSKRDEMMTNNGGDYKASSMSEL